MNWTANTPSPTYQATRNGPLRTVPAAGRDDDEEVDASSSSRSVPGSEAVPASDVDTGAHRNGPVRASKRRWPGTTNAPADIRALQAFEVAGELPVRHVAVRRLPLLYGGV